MTIHRGIDASQLQAVERLRANQTGGTGSRKFEWAQALEAVLEVKTWLFIGMALCLNVTANVTNTFGPIIVGGFGFDEGVTSLLNIPFGAVQLLIIFPASYLAHRFSNKSGFVAAVMLYRLGREKGDIPPLLAAYYLLAFLFGANPLIVSWMISNIAGTTKKSVIMSIFNIGVSAGNIIGPLLFSERDAPYYKPGLTKTMGVTGALLGLVALQLANLVFLNKRQEARRVRNGKPAKVHDSSMERRFVAGGGEEEGAVQMGGNELDLTDGKNDEFVYVY